MSDKLALVFDTSNEKVIIGVSKINPGSGEVSLIEQISVDSKRESNQKLLPLIDECFKRNCLNVSDIEIVGVGRGPGSFTGVRIALASAKGICSALNVPLLGMSTLDAIAENARLKGYCGELLVVADAMRGEVYPVLYEIKKDEIIRKNADCVVKPKDYLETNTLSKSVLVAGDGLVKFSGEFKDKFELADESYWYPTGESLLSLLKQNLDMAGDPGRVLPIYTRLSDAEENEISKIRNNQSKNLVSGVQGDSSESVLVFPCEVKDCKEIEALEAQNFERDAWSCSNLEDDIKSPSRIWLKAIKDKKILGYAGFSYSGDSADLLKICVDENFRRNGIAKALLKFGFETLRNLGVDDVILEVRTSNLDAISFYEKAGFDKVCVRKNFYGDEDAVSFKRDISEFSNASKFEIEPKDADFSGASRPLIFAIESSCDETAGAIVDGKDRVLSSVVSSSAKFHARFGGVVPEIASRKHIEVISQVAFETLSQVGLSSFDAIDAIAVTSNPGLVGSLVVGVAFAKGVCWAAKKPLIFVDHLIGHLFANKLSKTEIKFPAVASLISGGNTLLVLVKNWGEYEVLGGTIDDAVGEAYDKIARSLGLPYPGGPEISSLSANGDPNAISLPRPLLHSHDLKMSLSGLKTAVILEIEKLKEINENAGRGSVLTTKDMRDICASFEKSICDVQVTKAKDACIKVHANTFCFGGGVAANSLLRDGYKKMCEELKIEFVVAPKEVCGDNAAMIGLAAQFEFKNANFKDLTSDVSSSSKLNSRV